MKEHVLLIEFYEETCLRKRNFVKEHVLSSENFKGSLNRPQNLAGSTLGKQIKDASFIVMTLHLNSRQNILFLDTTFVLYV